MRARSSNGNGADPHLVALRALGWIVSEEGRAHRLIDLTGLDPHMLRAHADEPAMLDAVLGFLEGHEPDLIACAAALDISPETLVAARAALSPKDRM